VRPLTTGIWLMPFVLFSSAIVAQAPLFATACSDDEHIAANKKAAFDSSALQFFSTLISSDPAGAYDQLAVDAQKNVTREQITQISKFMLQPMKMEHLRVDHTYDVIFAGSNEGRVVCGTLSDGKWVSVAARSGEQAHVLLSADFINGRYAFEAWLLPDRSKWKIEGFWSGASSLADYDAEKVWTLARSEVSKKHRFNAAVLYATALQLTNRGNYLQLGLSNAISEGTASFSPPPEIAGQPPYEWKDGSSVYKILNIGPTAIAGKLYIVINHEVSHWTNEKEVDGWNKNLRAYFKRTFPEYRSVFPSVIIRAHERGTTRGFGTVEEDTETGAK
jgi:hypothetical protein